MFSVDGNWMWLHSFCHWSMSKCLFSTSCKIERRNNVLMHQSSHNKLPHEHSFMRFIEMEYIHNLCCVDRTVRCMCGWAVDVRSCTCIIWLTRDWMWYRRRWLQSARLPAIPENSTLASSMLQRNIKCILFVEKQVLYLYWRPFNPVSIFFLWPMHF